MAPKAPAEMTLNDEQVAIQQSYDDYPYESFPFSMTHPDRLSVLASLFGMQAADFNNCRVLELGCASGGNLIPMALEMPKSQFFGIDLSSKQVQLANDVIKGLKLKNIKIEHKDILDLSGKIRKFDFIICHGVYSWVPKEVQQKILQVCKQYLNENGVVYVSYNTYPGWHMRESVRNMMRFHTSNFENPQDKVNQARALLKFMVDSLDTKANAYGQYLKSELDMLSSKGDAYLLHEHLEKNNQPVYFHEFCQAADEAGLQYLAESEFHAMLASNFPAEVAATLAKVGNNIVQQEQYMDFLRNRTFRSTLLCHKDIQLTRNVDAGVLKNMHLSAMPMRILKSEDGEQSGSGSYLSLAGVQVNIGDGLAKEAYSLLAERWPLTIPFNELCDKAIKQAGLPAGDYADALAADLLKLYTAKAIELHQRPSSFTVSVSDKPKVSSLARLQAKDSHRITNMLHEVASINEPTRQLLLLLDGENSRAEILDKLLALVSKGELVLREDEVEITDKGKQRQYAQQFLDRILAELGKRALLVS